jgi:mycothiol synthase
VADEIVVRPGGRGDAAAIAALLNRIAQAAYGESELDEAEVLAWLDDPNIDVVLAEHGGELVGYGDSGWAQERPEVVWLDVRPLGDTSGAGPRLVDELERRALEREDAMLLRAYVASVEPRLAEALVERGYELIRHSFRMARELDGPPEPVALPEGIELRPYRPGDEDRVYEAHMEAFADHWEFHRTDFDEWRRWNLDRPGVDPRFWHLAYDGDELAGLSLCRPYSADEPHYGWVSVLGVRPRWRRAGLGLALLVRSFADFAAKGFTRVGLGVDGENTTGAVRLYERAGMTPTRRYDLYQRAR